MVDVDQQVVLLGRRHQFSPDERLVAHDVERTAKAVVGIVLEIGLGHLAAHDVERLLLVDILAGLTVIVDDEAHPQFLPCSENGLQGCLHAVQVDVAGQGHDTRQVVLHHFREFHAVIEDSQLGLEQRVQFHIVDVYFIMMVKLLSHILRFDWQP